MAKIIKDMNEETVILFSIFKVEDLNHCTLLYDDNFYSILF